MRTMFIVSIVAFSNVAVCGPIYPSLESFLKSSLPDKCKSGNHLKPRNHHHPPEFQDGHGEKRREVRASEGDASEPWSSFVMSCHLLLPHFPRRPYLSVERKQDTWSYSLLIGGMSRFYSGRWWHSSHFSISLLPCSLLANKRCNNTLSLG